MTLSLTIGVLVAGGIYLLLQRSYVRIIFGVMLLSHAANFILLSTGVLAWRGEPIVGVTPAADAADPLPMAFVLTAIVITFALAIVMVAFAVIGHNDDSHRLPETGEGHEQ